MKVGDKVRLLKGTEEGIIVDIKKDKIVEIEIEEGFVIPALKSEVVVIDRKEEETFGTSNQTDEAPESENPMFELPPGIYLALSESPAGGFHGYLINQTEDSILFTLSVQSKKNLLGMAHGVLERQTVKDLGELMLQSSDKGPRVITHCIIHQKEGKFKKPPIVSILSIRPSILAQKKFIPAIGTEVSICSIDEEPVELFDPIQLKERMMEGGAPRAPKKEELRGMREDSVDLHLDPEDRSLNPDQVFDFQIEKFEKAYDRALVMNLEKLKIIHGVGAGVLRNEIHKRLTKKGEVKYFEDGDKERFGFGSTIIYF